MDSELPTLFMLCGTHNVVGPWQVFQNIGLIWL